jgi:plasmid stability protein
MQSLTIRNIDARLKARLRVRAARHGRSMEEEVRVILRDAVASESTAPNNLVASIARQMAKAGGGVDLEIPPREPMRDPPRFSVQR